MSDVADTLLVEDNTDDAFLVLRSLRKAGVRGEVRWVRDGEAALEALLGDDADPLPARVILDLQLPRYDGFEVLERLRGDPRTRDLVVLVFTSSQHPDDRARCAALGAQDFVTKPVDAGAFDARVRAMVARWWPPGGGPNQPLKASGGGETS